MKIPDFRMHNFILYLVNNSLWDDVLYWNFEKIIIQSSNNLVNEKEKLEYKKQLILLLLEISNLNIDKIELINKLCNKESEIYADSYARFERIRDLCFYKFYNKSFNNQNYDFKL